MNSQLNTLNSPKSSILVPKSAILSRGNTFIPVKSLQYPRKKLENNRINASSKNFDISPSSTTAATEERSYNVKAITTVTVGGNRVPDDTANVLGATVRLELISSELDPNTKLEKETIKSLGQRASQAGDEVKHECDFVIPKEFGEIGAVLVENEYHKEMFFKDIVLSGFPFGDVTVPCNSWVHSKHDDPKKRLFFISKSYLPSKTPNGLSRLRAIELENMRGNGAGERKTFERIYDYDTYNDLGDPDKSSDLARPVLGGDKHPYPRRCRTGRQRCKSDPASEGRSSSVYVPRDEALSEGTQVALSLQILDQAVFPQLETSLADAQLGFPSFTAIDSLFTEGIRIENVKNEGGILQLAIPRLFRATSDERKDTLLFEPPETINRDKFSWLRDEEFARQSLAGFNPYSIELVREWPLRSKLNPEIYGPSESFITTELVEKEIGGQLSVKTAFDEKRLFMLDYHDIYLPYVSKSRELKGTTLYGSRTLFFLTEESTLQPIAIELTRPREGNKPQWKQVFTPSRDVNRCWLWRLAKAHVCAHDASYNQIIHHWLRTHCCTEPYIIAANRQLSAMHPIYRLLHPHFRNTMGINALARQGLISAGGIIESSYSPGKYSIEISSVVYDQLWRFDMEALPADLIRRGMAVEDPSAEHGLKLAIEDYPFANDGLDLWAAIKQWVRDYVNRYYPEPKAVESDYELQGWWTEVRTKGHVDKKDEPWWPVLKTQEDLIHILTTIIWVTSGHHAAVNFGQYVFGGYFPNRPTMARTKMPTEDPSPESFQRFLEKPELMLLECFPSQIQATTLMAILDVLSNHSADEEYLGDQIESSFLADPVIKAAFERFNSRLKQLERKIDEKNANLKLRNRSGAGVVPYELLKPFSEPGVTGKGVPNSISI